MAFRKTVAHLNPVSQNRLLHTLAHKLSYEHSPHVVTAKVVLKPGRERERLNLISSEDVTQMEALQH